MIAWKPEKHGRKLAVFEGFIRNLFIALFIVTLVNVLIYLDLVTNSKGVSNRKVSDYEKSVSRRNFLKIPERLPLHP